MAVIRARVFPRWVGGLFILSVPVSAVPLPGPLAELGDYLAFFAFVVIAWIIVFGHASQPAIVPDLGRSSQAPA